MKKKTQNTITDTEFKFKEVKYFLSLLSRRSTIGEKFDFLLNAFVNSARSITWIMKAEFSKVDGWRKWYNSKKANEEENKLLRLFNEMRISSTKIKPLKTALVIVFSVIIPKDDKVTYKELNEILKPGKVKVTFYKKGAKARKPSKGLLLKEVQIEEICRPIREYSEEDALKLCKKYFAFLENLVNECVEKFGEKTQEVNQKDKIIIDYIIK